VKVCTSYRAGGEKWDDVPPNQTLFHEAEPVWEELPGWEAELDACRSFDELPAEARTYVRAIEELGGVRVSVVGVGPAREQTLPVPA
jgi:adenylosuccinate synthase